MNRIRCVSVALAFTVVSLLTACGSGGASITEPSAAASAPASSSSTSAQESASSEPSQEPSEGASGDSFCDAFASLTDPALSNISSPAEAAAQMRKLASQLRDTAPSEVSKAASDYALLFETIATSLEGNQVDAAEAQAALAEALSDTNSDSIVKIAMYAATNCTS